MVSTLIEQGTTDRAEQLVKIVRENIRARRIELGNTQSEIAARLGCKQPVIAMIENGSSGISLEMLANICDALRTVPAAIVTEGAFAPPLKNDEAKELTGSGE